MIIAAVIMGLTHLPIMTGQSSHHDDPNAAQHRLDLSPYAGASPASSSLHAVSSYKSRHNEPKSSLLKMALLLQAEERIIKHHLLDSISFMFLFYSVPISAYTINTNNILPHHTIHKYVLTAFLHFQEVS